MLAAAVGLLAGSAGATTPLWMSTLDGETALAVERRDPLAAGTTELELASGGVQLLRAASGPLLLVESVGVTGDSPTADDNDFTRVDVAVQALAALGDGARIRLVGTFDWTETHAAASWVAADYGLIAPTGIANVTFGAQALGDAVILGPGDLPTVGYEGFLAMFGGTFHGWTIENLDIRGFDWAIAMFYNASGDFNGVTVRNNRIVMPADLNATHGADESWQNVALHLGFGTDQTISGNEIVVPGDGLSDTSDPTAATYAATVVLQSNTSGGTGYDGLEIVDNVVRVLHAPSADPEIIYGFWENGHAHQSDILVARNGFLNEDPANDPALNLQRAFRVTSHSSPTTTVSYADNTVIGAARAIGWIGGGYTSNPPSTVEPVLVTGNTLLGNGIGVWVHSDGVDPNSKATLFANRIVGNATGLLVENAQVTAEDNWWGCSGGPGSTECDVATFTPDGFLDADPWLVLDLSAPAAVEVGNHVALLASLQGNSDGIDLGPIPFPPVAVAFAAGAGAVATPVDTVEGAATSTYTGVTQGLDAIQAVLDNAVATTSILVTEGGAVTVQSVQETSDTPTLADNDYTRINALVQALVSGVTLELDGTFDWTEPFAALAWSYGSDGVDATGDEYAIVAPGGLENVTITSATPGGAVIQGPGDLPGLNLEGFLGLWNGSYHGWTIQGLDIRGFDSGIFAYFTTVTDFNGFSILDNRIELPADLNRKVAPADVNQNIAIHLSFGIDQTIQGNEIVMSGTGISDTSDPTDRALAASVALQSNTSGGTAYDGLQILDNLVRITGAQSADPERIYGIWENGHAHQSDILVAGNSFINEHPDNDPALNLQRAFRVTSHSSATTTVTYASNTVIGAARAIGWMDDGYTINPPASVEPVLIVGNTLLDNGLGVWVHSDGADPNSKATLLHNRIVGNTDGLLVENAVVTAEDNWWGCNDGPNALGCDTATLVGAGSLDADPWLVLTVDPAAVTIPIGGSRDFTGTFVDSDGLPVAATEFPAALVSFAASVGSVTPATTAMSAGSAVTVYTAPAAAGAGQLTATLDGQTVAAAVTVTADADLSAALTPTNQVVAPGDPLQIDAVFANAGPAPAGAVVQVDVPDVFVGASWTCTASGGATCTASGSGDVADSVVLPAGSTVTYTITATLAAGFEGHATALAEVTATAPSVDQIPGDNAAAATVRSTVIFTNGFEDDDTNDWSSWVGLAP